jgi:anti-anti-sigma regulatory factor
MLAPLVFPSAARTRATYVVDLIGDLDAQLARSFCETMKRLAPSADERVVVHLRHVFGANAVGVAGLAVGIEALQSDGCDLSVVAGSKRIRTLLRAARVPTSAGFATDRSASVRHVMIVRNSDPSRDCA